MNRCIAIMKGMVCCAIALMLFSCNSKREGNPRILVFSKTSGYHHESIAAGNTAIEKLGLENNFLVDTTTDASMFNEDSLKKYAAVVFLSTTGNVLDNYQEAAFERYIQAGGGYMGIHAAADCEYDWGWYGRMAGAYFLDHPGINDTFPNVQEAELHVTDKNHPATKDLPDTWKKKDEYYSFKKISPDTKVIMTIDEKTYHGGKNGENHPIAWYHDYDGGRAFYTELGHTTESFSDSLYLKHILGGIEYAMGDNSELNYSKATTQIPPDADRFVKTQLVEGEFYEPTEMTILPNLDIMIIERRGAIKLYNHETKKVKQVGFFDVYFASDAPGVNAEEGMLGLSKDPDYDKNHWVYIYYSPADSSVNRLSRFTFENDTLSKATEKVILEVKSDRDICCHTGGSIAFGPDKLLYFSAGDNSTPFDERGQAFVSHGFAPLNDEPGHQQYDARRSAGNTNDLRGKIMRIKVNDDGTYDIPEGNLFPKGTAKTRPEIYVMGNRNPYRISVDQKTGYLYWGEVGPDAREDSFSTRGSRGYDEVNQARKSGYFGWPLFVGNNYPYHEYNYATGESGEAFDPAKPMNRSRNNTGLAELPPAQPAFIWYPYAVSPDFPQMNTGGRNAMAGPVYYTDMFPKETRLPDYYNGKLFIYDWVRGIIRAVTMLPNGDFDKMEPFLQNAKLNAVIDMETGPDGRIYMLEYGNGWFSKNPDAGLARIDYISGNRPPAVGNLKVEKNTGVIPYTVRASVEAKDPENDKISYVWNFGDGSVKETNEPNVAYTYNKSGDFDITVAAKDSKGDSAISAKVPVYSGNDRPIVNISLEGGNQSFYLPGLPVKYAVTAQDPADSSAIDPANFFVSVEYVNGFDQAQSSLGHQMGTATVSGKNLMLSMDCKTCHKEAEKSIGPAYTEVAKKYQRERGAMNYLVDKIKKGGAGVWGEVAMPAHPGASDNDVRQIVTWILSLANTTNRPKSLPPSGTITPPAAEAPGTVMVLSASYTDKGGENIKPLTGNASAMLPGSNLSFTGKEKLDGFSLARQGGNNALRFTAQKGSVGLSDIDLTGVQAVTINTRWEKLPGSAVKIEIYLDEPGGKLLGSKTINPTSTDIAAGVSDKIPIEKVTDGKMHTIYISYQASGPLTGSLAGIIFNAK